MFSVWLAALFVRLSIKAQFLYRSGGARKEDRSDKKDDKKSEKDGKDEGKGKDELKAGSSDRSRASKSGNSNCLSAVFSSILLLKEHEVTFTQLCSLPRSQPGRVSATPAALKLSVGLDLTL